VPDDVAPEVAALELHQALVEALKQLNRAELESEEGEGLEPTELLLLLRKGACPLLSERELERAVETLVANRLAETTEDPRYAWDRGRLLGRRYTITTEGKEFLLRQIERPGRVD
jgi:hypothetical protein